MTVPITPVKLGDVVKLKKPHPCGANEWEITKLGMDIGMTCVGCDRKVRLERLLIFIHGGKGKRRAGRLPTGALRNEVTGCFY